jgi:hypothetical protein
MHVRTKPVVGSAGRPIAVGTVNVKIPFFGRSPVK